MTSLFHNIHTGTNVKSKKRTKFSVTRGRALTICTEISVENFRQMVLAFFWHRKQERDLFVPFTKYQLSFRFLWTWSLALVIQTNGTENFGRFGKNRKKVKPRKVLLSFWKISTGMKRSIWILHGISGFSIQMVSARNLMVWPFKWNLFSSTFNSLPADVLWGTFVTHLFLPRGGEISHATIYLVCNSKFCVGKWNPMVLLFKWNLLSNTFTWYYLFSM